MMNERFLSLVDRAQELSYKEYEKRLTGHSREDLFNRIFAELIVHDCLRIAEEQRIKILKNPDDPSWTEHLAEVQTNIRQHFWS